MVKRKLTIEQHEHHWDQGELMLSGRISSQCSTSNTRHITLAEIPLINHEWGRDWIVNTTNEIYSWSFVTQIFRNGHGGDRKIFGDDLNLNHNDLLVQWFPC